MEFNILHVNSLPAVVAARRLTGIIIFAGIFMLISMTACSPDVSSGTNTPFRVVCTTSMIGDAVTQIAGDKAAVHILMGSGVDPHLYKATQGDLRHLINADLILYNGLHLEGKMGEVFHKLSRTKKVVALAELLPRERLLHPAGDLNAYDPHVWFDAKLWADIVRLAGKALAETDSTNQHHYIRQAESHARAFDSLHLWIATQIESIPLNQRVLITAHDAFGYFGKAYHVEVRGLQGISTASEYGLRDISELVNFISTRKIKSVFVESTISSKSLEAVVEGCARRGHTVSIGGHLYTDALGAPDTPQGTCIGAFRTNVQAICAALK
jgi:manganese/zinc/iron transport system substrate-binding protein